MGWLVTGRGPDCVRHFGPQKGSGWGGHECHGTEEERSGGGVLPPRRAPGASVWEAAGSSPHAGTALSEEWLR